MPLGMRYGEAEPTEDCPYCGNQCRADWVDIGVGLTQAGPFHCIACHASEIGPYDKARDLDECEVRTGWYKPQSEPGSSANVLGGKVVSHAEMLAAYRAQFLGNPLYEVPGTVDEWLFSQRKVR